MQVLISAPSLAVSPEDGVVEKYGTDTTLQCVVAELGSFQPMEWYFEGEKLVDDGEKYEMNNNNGTLTVLSVSK